MFDEQYIDCIFEKFKSLITYTNFIEAIKPKDLMEQFGGIGFEVDLNPFDDEDNSDPLQGTADWLFKPQKIREIYKKHLENEDE